jgi:spermidine synthase
VVIDDGRRFLLRNPEKYDVILLDALKTTSAYSSNLYSQNFLKIVRDHLKPKGVFLMWSDEHRISLMTLLSSFEYIRAYGVFRLAPQDPFKLNKERHKALVLSFRDKTKDFAALSQSNQFRFITGHHGRLQNPRYLIRDWKPICEYYLGRPSDW